MRFYDKETKMKKNKKQKKTTNKLKTTAICYLVTFLCLPVSLNKVFNSTRCFFSLRVDWVESDHNIKCCICYNVIS